MEIQRMLIGRAVTGLDVRQPDLRIYRSDTRKAGRSAREWDVRADTWNQLV
jgi:hypothetical protein